MEDKSLDILLVDNEAEFCESMSYWLETKHHRVHVCYSGEEALTLIKNTPLDIVFLDIQMPGMDGMAVLREIRSFNTTLPIVMVTGYPKEERMTEAISLGVSGFFPKTSSFEELGRIIKASIRTHKDLH
ncbi:MAG: response regulator [Candidatus Omnitrophota bacterium]|jgi:DNA-binding response OmpR family regulator|nr:response regulator [Candidatus Omnitrophota bacterium]MDD5137973.1 response regulator [Candidatus Omnitrophota bacterium]MDD5537731.1 response regulator [Candidatus Omnitrophota bacterium]